jgi:hypothetical protein
MIYDKRKLKRYDIFLIVEFKPLRSNGGFSIGITRDLSTDGFSIEAQTIECQRGDIMEFRFKHPDAELTVDIPGEVVWRNHSWYKYVIGIKFLNVNEEQKAKILKIMSAVRDAENKPELTGKDTESVPETEKEKMPEVMLGAVARDNPLADVRITKTDCIALKDAAHCELTDSERTFIAKDVYGTGNDNGKKDLPAQEYTDYPEKRFKETLLRDIELHPGILQGPVDNKAVEVIAHIGKINEAAPDHEKPYTANFDAGSRRDAAQAKYNIAAIEKRRKKKLWLYVPLATIVIIIFAIALPVMIKKFNNSSTLTVTESADYINTEKDEDISASNNAQMSSRDLNEPSVPSPARNAKADNVPPVEQDKAVDLLQVSSRGDSAGILPSKSNVIAEVKNQKTEYVAHPAEADKTVKNILQVNNANLVRTETGPGEKPLQDKIEKNRKIDLIANIDETLNNLRTIQNEKPQETVVVIETKKMPEYKPIVKTEKQPSAMQIVKREETPPVAVTESKKIPEVEQEVMAAFEEKKEGAKKTGSAVKMREMPNVVLLVKRDKSRNTQNNSSATPGITTADLLKKWKHIGSTKSGVPLFIAPDNISYPYEHVVNLIVKASVNKKDFVDVLAINCSQIKLRILEEHNGNNPAFSSYSNEWKDIIPDSMILYSSACPGKK